MDINQTHTTQNDSDSEFYTTLANELRRDEGVRHKPYKDSVGLTTIGVGRNLDHVGLSDIEVQFLLVNDIKTVIDALDRELPWWRGLTTKRRLAMANLCFNMGINGLLQFKQTLAMLQSGKYDHAARLLLQSKYATQVGPRAKRIAEKIKLG